MSVKTHIGTIVPMPPVKGVKNKGGGRGEKERCNNFLKSR